MEAEGRMNRNHSQLGLKDLLAAYERDLLRSALEASGGNQSRAAKILGVLPTTLLEKMKRLGIPTARGRVADPLPFAPR